MPLFFLGTREWRNRQTRTVQVRVPVMEWGFNSPLAHDETADPSGSAVFVFPGCGLWPRWCSGRRRARLWGRAALWGPAAVCAGGRRPAREIATRELRSEWSISRPALALPPPTGTAARPRHRPSISHVIPLRLVQTVNLRRWNCNVFGVSRKMTAINYVRNMGGGDVLAPVGTAARPRASKPGQAPPPPTGTAADPSGALHTSGDWSLMCYWVRCFEARPGPAPRRVPYPQFRMQFPDTCSSSLSEKPGISTIIFQSMKCARGNCMRVFGVAGTLIPAGRVKSCGVV